MQKNKLGFLLAGILCFSSPAWTAVTPLSVAIVAPIQFPHRDYGITGLRVSGIWGKHRSIYGFDFGGIGNITDQTFVGIGVSGIFNFTRGNTTILGLQLAGITNINEKAKVFGLQLALGVNHNITASSVAGFQIALFNLSSHTKIYGFQIGIFNQAVDVYGFQIGVINDTQTLHGLQIGLLNFHRKGTFFVSPGINIGF